MGYTHGRKWSEDEVKKEIMNIVETLDLKHFPTKSQIINFYGNNSLANKISRSGGSRYYADLLRLEIVNCESEFGNFFEEFAIDEILENTGFSSLHTKARYPYDLLTNGNIKVDVKASMKVKNKKANLPYHSFNLEKKRTNLRHFYFLLLE